MPDSLKGKVVAVTGAGSGIGRAMSAEFAARGAKVAALDIDSSSASDTVAALSRPSTGTAINVDVSNAESVTSAVAEVLEWAGRIDVLCNNAGVADSYRPAHMMSLTEWERTIAVDLTGPFLMSRAVIPAMLERGGGSILNTASIASFSAACGGPAYTAAKHGVIGLTRQLTFDYGRQGIRVNAICPGAISTGLTAPETSEFFPDTDEEIDSLPARRWGQAEEIAKLAAFLAGEEAAYVFGTSVVIDGGWLSAARTAI